MKNSVLFSADGSIFYLLLPNGMEAVIDAEDFDKVCHVRWNAYKSSSGKVWYVRGYTGGRNVLLHRLVMGAEAGQQLDHKNRDGLDNRKSNLRFCSSAQNCRNRGVRRDAKSRWKGVTPTRRGRYRASIHVRGREVRLGIFRSELMAAAAYNKAAKRHFGKFASLNDIDKAGPSSSLDSCRLAPLETN